MMRDERIYLDALQLEGEQKQLNQRFDNREMEFFSHKDNWITW